VKYLVAGARVRTGESCEKAEQARLQLAAPGLLGTLPEATFAEKQSGQAQQAGAKHE
jgi:hypothetical protein